MSVMFVEMLAPEKVSELWPALEPMYEAACNSHEIAKDEISAEDIRELAATGMCALFVGYIDQQPTCTIAIQFNITNGKKGADLIAMAGQHLLKFKAAYWETILDWLKANDVAFLDAYVPENRVEIYKRKFGFNKSCSYVRKSLH